MAAEEGGSGPKGGPPPQQTDPEVVQRKVYVHGTKGLNEEDLRWIFEHYGQACAAFASSLILPFDN